MQVIIPMAGKGTRLRPHTHSIPKPLIKVAGKEMLAHILDELKPLGVKDIYFIVGHLGERLGEFVRKSYPEFNSHFIVQDELLGTAHAVKMAEDHIGEDVLVLFADALFDADLSESQKLPKDWHGIVWVKEMDDPSKYGVIVTNEDGSMKGIVEKPEKPGSRMANIGIHYFRDYKMMFEAINQLLAGKPAKNGEYYLTDAMQIMVEKGAHIKTVPVNAWFDCGHPEALIETNQWLLERGLHSRPKVVEHEGVVIHDPVRIAEDVVLDK